MKPEDLKNAFKQAMTELFIQPKPYTREELLTRHKEICVEKITNLEIDVAILEDTHNEEVVLRTPLSLHSNGQPKSWRETKAIEALETSRIGLKKQQQRLDVIVKLINYGQVK